MIRAPCNSTILSIGCFGMCIFENEKKNLTFADAPSKDKENPNFVTRVVKL